MKNRQLCIVDDDIAVLESLTALFETNGFDVSAFDSPGKFLESPFAAAPIEKRPHVDCLVVDFKMPEMSGVELQQRLVAASVDFPVIVITAFGEVRAAVEALKLGADDFIEKPFDDDVLLAAVGQAIARTEVVRQRLRERKQAQDRLASLSPREQEILAQVAAGASSKAIAYNLGISRRTVEIHRTNIMRKANALNLAELVGLAFQADYRPDD